MQKLLELNDPAALTGGLFPSLAPNQPALWRDGSNVYFKDGKVQKFPGYERIIDNETQGPIKSMAQAYIGSQARVYYGTGSKVKMWEPGDVVGTEIASSFSLTNLAPFGEHLLIGNAYGAPFLWPGAGMASVIADYNVGGAATIIKIFNNHAVAIDGQTVRWSNKSDFTTWTPTPENTAGDLFIRDLDSDVVAMQPLGTALGLYTTDSLYLLQYLGAPLVIGILPGINGIGALSDSSIIPVGRKNYGVSKKGFFVTDGIEFDYIDGPAVNSWFKKRSAGGFHASSFVGLHYEQIETVCWWFKPNVVYETAECVGLAYNYKNQSWTILRPKGTVEAAIEQQVFDYPLIAVYPEDFDPRLDHSWGSLNLPNLNWEGTTAGIGTDAQETLLETFQLDAGERERYKRWDMLRVEIEYPWLHLLIEDEEPLEYPHGMEVRFGFSDAPGADPEWTAWAPLEYENWIHRESVYLTVALRGQALDTSWSIGGAAIHGEMGGYL